LRWSDGDIWIRADVDSQRLNQCTSVSQLQHTVVDKSKLRVDASGDTEVVETGDTWRTPKQVVKPQESYSGFNGKWKDKGTIRGKTLIWESGTEVLLEFTSSTTVNMMFQGEVYHGELLLDGRLRWSDGDIWIRADPSADRMFNLGTGRNYFR